MLVKKVLTVTQRFALTQPAYLLFYMRSTGEYTAPTPPPTLGKCGEARKATPSTSKPNGQADPKEKKKDKPKQAEATIDYSSTQFPEPKGPHMVAAQEKYALLQPRVGLKTALLKLDPVAGSDVQTIALRILAIHTADQKRCSLLQIDDVIVAMEGHPFERPGSLYLEAKKRHPGDRLKLLVQRGNKQLTVVVILGSQLPEAQHAMLHRVASGNGTKKERETVASPEFVINDKDDYIWGTETPPAPRDTDAVGTAKKEKKVKKNEVVEEEDDEEEICTKPRDQASTKKKKKQR